MRCSGAKASPPDEKGKAVGFRCCGGPENSAEVELPAATEELAAVEAVEPLDDALVARVKRAIQNGQMKEESYSIEKVWRWRPVKNEELYVARYVATPSGGGAVQPVVVQLCERTALLLARLRGPVSELGDLAAGEAGATEVRMSLKGGADAGDVKFTYRFGQVNVAQPAWVKEGAALADAGAPEGGAPAASSATSPAASPAKP
jgi:hypothetical protein